MQDGVGIDEAEHTPTPSRSTPPPSTEPSAVETSEVQSPTPVDTETPHGGSKEKDVVGKAAADTPVETSQSESIKPVTQESSQKPDLDKPSSLTTPTSPPPLSVPMTTESGVNKSAINDGGSEPVTPQTPTAAGQLGGVFTRLRKAWQGAEPKVRVHLKPYKRRLQLPSITSHIQWNLSIPDTLGTTKSVQYKEVSLFQRLIYTHLY